MSQNEWVRLHNEAEHGLNLPRFFLSTANIQRTLDNRRDQKTVHLGDTVLKRYIALPLTTQIRVEGERVVAVRCQVEHWAINEQSPSWSWERQTEWKAIAVPKLVATWDQFRRRCPNPDEYKRVIRHTPEWHMAVMRADGAGEPYVTTEDSCTCGSFRSQAENAQFLEQYLEDFKPICKHMTWLKLFTSREEHTRALWRVDSDNRVIVTVWPTTRPITSPFTKKELTPEGGFQHYGTYDAARLPELHAIAIQRGWSFEQWQPDPTLAARMAVTGSR